MVDLRDIKPGDDVLVRITVDSVPAPGRIGLRTPPGAWVSPDKIVGHFPRPLAVGDRVRTPGGNEGTIDHIRDDEAILVWRNPRDFRSGLSGPVLVKSLTRIPDEAVG